ncbi:MAG: hypothetical protein Q8M02_07475 [Candidatus Didemnitutus sp.]|nr:hypothetical protein [Candidatus Didemnitutus sp.]
MMFGKKNKGFCVDFGDQAVLLARTNQERAPLVVEEIKEFATADPEGLQTYLQSAEGRGPTGYAHSSCGIFPAKRLIRRQALDLKKIKEPTYFKEIISQQFRLEADKYTTQILNPADGSDFESAKGTPKEALFCGMPAEDIIGWQDRLLELGVYPERLELGSLALLGALANYQKFKDSKIPVLLLEIGDDATQSYIVSADGIEVTRPIASGIAAMIPIVQKELGLKDEESAKKLFYSNTFDFTSMGGTLVKKLLKELHSSIGFYEVQTGQTVGLVLTTQLPPNLAWLGGTIASGLGVSSLKVDLLPWLESLGITFAADVATDHLDERWIGLFGLMAAYEYAPPAEKA